MSATTLPDFPTDYPDEAPEDYEQDEDDREPTEAELIAWYDPENHPMFDERTQHDPSL